MDRNENCKISKGRENRTKLLQKLLKVVVQRQKNKKVMTELRGKEIRDYGKRFRKHK